MSTTNGLLGELSVSSIKGIGAKISAKLAKININSVQDLLLHLPRRYEDRTSITPLSEVVAGEYCTVVGKVYAQIARPPLLFVFITDGVEKMTLRFFRSNAAMMGILQRGGRISAFGEIKKGKAMMEMLHPDYHIIDAKTPLVLRETLSPIYPSTEGISNSMLNKFINLAIPLLDEYQIEELIPTTLTPFPYDLRAALKTVHNPPKDADVELLHKGEHPAQQRLIFEELLAHQLAMLRNRIRTQSLPAHVLTAQGRLSQHFVRSLPFELTKAQKRVVGEIYEDLKIPHPMLRLVQGDVGSGKTLVAALAALRAIENHKQACLMAPTEILAEQHYGNFKKFFNQLNIKVVFLAGKIKGPQRTEILQQIANGQAHLIIGTHAIFQQSVQFCNLSLVIIDEQHRFGVEQRLALIEKGKHQIQRCFYYPHQLVMTATPIPRTLAMASYGDLDVSIIDELPPGRSPVHTVAMSNLRRDEVVYRVGSVCINEGRQAYWVCTLIDESEVMQAKAAQELYENLLERLPMLKIGLIHGRMKPQQKQQIMERFKNRRIDVLVATTVIEVGVDVPNASIMIIENAERLGLSQLHQLRGRVGRGVAQSFCILLYQPPLGAVSRQRLNVMKETTNGFIIAEKDLQIRGFGEVLGTKQTGAIAFKIADLDRDQHLFEAVQHCAQLMVREHHSQSLKIIKRWLNDGHYEKV